MGGGAEIWEKAIRKVRVGMMPPQGAAQPDAATRARLVAARDALDAAAIAAPNPGRPLLHRSTGPSTPTPFAILLALDVDPATLLPPDDSAYGFDNIGDVLGMSPVLLERYMDAAGKVSALAVGDPDVGPSSETFRIRQDASQDVHIDGMPLGTVGGILAPVTLPLDGEYMITVQMFRTNLGVMRGLEYEHEIAYTVDGQEVHRFRMGGEADFKANLVNMTKAGDQVDERGRVRLRLTAGPHVIAAAFVARSAAVNPTRLQPFVRSSTDTRDTSGHPHFDLLTVTGPFNPTGPGATPSRARVFTCQPKTAAEEDPCAQEDHRDAGAPGLPRRRDRRRSAAPLCLLSGRPPDGQLRARHREGASAHSRQPEIRVPPRARSGGRRARHGVPDQRSRARLAAVVLPLEQHSRR